MGIVKEFWLFSKDGLPIAEYCNEENIDKSFIGGFVSAIKSFSQQLSKKGLKSFLLQNNKFMFISALEGSAIMVCRTDSDAKDKKIQKFCGEIEKILVELYKPEDILNWSGDRSFFDGFSKKLNGIFEKEI